MKGERWADPIWLAGVKTKGFDANGYAMGYRRFGIDLVGTCPMLAIFCPYFWPLRSQRVEIIDD